MPPLKTPRIQIYRANKIGKRIPMHTPEIGDACVCTGCHQRRWWTPERRAARAVVIRAGYAAGQYRRTKNTNKVRANYWTDEQVARLHALIGKHDVQTIAAILTQEFKCDRSEQAVKKKCLALGISRLMARPYTAVEVGQMFGISRETVRQRFVKTGLLVGQNWRGGPHGMLVFPRASIEHLVAEHPEAYEPSLLTDSGLKALAQAATRGRRPLTTTDVTQLTKIDFRTLAAWYARGLVPSARKVKGVRLGAGGGWLIDASDLVVIRTLAEAAEARRQERAAVCPNGHPRAEHTKLEASGHRRCQRCRQLSYERNAPGRNASRRQARADAVA